jgi:hypothetical protein
MTRILEHCVLGFRIVHLLRESASFAPHDVKQGFRFGDSLSGSFPVFHRVCSGLVAQR